MELVSVIIPYYQKKKFIKKAVLSVTSQSYSKLEIIIIYDDQDFSDLSYIKSIKKIDKRIKLIINKKSCGAGISRNIGIQNSKGKFIAFLDSDDIWKTNKIKYQLKFMLKNKSNFSHTSYSIINDLGHIIGKRNARNFSSYDNLLKSCDIGLSTVMIRKKILSKKLQFPNLKTKEDFVLWLNILKNNNQIDTIKKNLVKWRKLKNSLSSSTFQKLLDGFRVYYVYMKLGFFKSLYLLFCLSFNFLLKK